jgi:hypothetical protein
MDDLMADRKSIVTEAKKRFERARDAYAESRKLAVSDTKFVMGDSDNNWQWPEDVRSQRANRACLTVNMTAQHCNQIVNAIRQNRPSVRVSPVDSGADKKTAEILGGLIRNIQVSSAADDAHDLAAEHSVYGGEGYWRVVTEYESETSFNQVISIKACPNPQQVYVDPDAKEPDKSDAMWGFVFEEISKEQFEREYPKLKPESWGDESTGGGWATDDSYRRAEYFYCEYEDDIACLLQTGATKLKSTLEETDQVAIDPKTGKPKERPTQVKRWKWCKLVGGHEEPIEEQDWLGDFLPIISVVGKELNVDGKIVRKGIVRDLKDPARMVNYAYSETVQTLALQNKVPYIAAAESIEGYEEQWKSANAENLAYLPWNAYDEQDRALPKPERQAPAVMPAAQVQLLQLSTEQMRAASGQQNANFGIKSEAASGVGIQRLKVQGETATFHFPDNLARALRYEAKLLINLIQKYYDTQRVVRILGLDGKEEKAILHPELPGAYQEVQGQDKEIQRIFNPQVGRYDVVIDTGPNFQTQRQEAAAAMTELASKNPQMMQVAGDIIVKTYDFPFAEELSERLAKAIPPELRDESELPPELQGQMQQMQQQGQEIAQALQACQQELESVKKDKKVEGFKAETERLKIVIPYLPAGALAAVAQSVGLDVIASDDISPPDHAMQQPVPDGMRMPPPGMEQGQEQPPQGGFSSPEQIPG